MSMSISKLTGTPRFTQVYANDSIKRANKLKTAIAVASVAVAGSTSHLALAASAYIDAAAPISVIDSSTLDVVGVTSLGDLLPGVGGLQIQTANDNSTALDFTLRGFGATTAASASGESGVGVFIDGVYQTRAQGLAMDIIDLDRIEVLTGPQGVLYGRNTIGGAVKVTSKKPSGELALSQRFVLGTEFDEFKSISHIDLPQLGVLSAKLSYLINDHEGWVENQDQSAVADNNNFSAKEVEGLRVALNFDLSDNVVVDYVYQDASSDTTPPYFLSIVAGSTGVAEQESGATATRGAVALPFTVTDKESHQLTATWQVSESLQIESISAYSELDTEQYTNFDGVLGAGVGVVIAQPDEQNQEQTSQEFRLTGSLRDGALNYVAGISYFDEDVQLSGAQASGSAEVESYAAYAQGTLALTDALALTVGWRETSDEKTIISDSLEGTVTGFQTEVEDDNTDLNVALSMTFNDQLSTYLGYSTAIKSGGASLLSFGLNPYDAESVETIEAGLDVALLDGRADISVVAFTADYKDRQLTFIDPDNALQNYIINATDDDTHEGIELDLRWAVGGGVSLRGSYNFLDVDTSRAPRPYIDDGFGGTVFQLGGGAQRTLYATRAPRHSGMLAFDWDVGTFEYGSLSVHADYSSASLQRFSSEGSEGDARSVINASVTLGDIQLEDDSGQLSISLWGKNLNDEVYVSNSVSLASSASIAQAFGEPRSYGVDILYRY